MDTLIASAEAEASRARVRARRAWTDWCAERYVRQLCLLEHLARGRKVRLVNCQECGQRHI